MGTRSGDIDPAIALELQLSREMSVDEIANFLNRSGSLKGLSGIGSDMRDLEARAAGGDDRVRLAITGFCHRVKKYIGAYAAAKGGVDVIVMTGGIGENSRSTRRRILQRLQFLGLHLDEDLNAKAQLNSTTPVTPLHASNSRTHAFAIVTNEELMTAHETVNMLEAAAAVTTTDSIPIAISARHLHLNETNLKQLFGARAQLTKAKDISQPGQFACEQKVHLNGLKRLHRRSARTSTLELAQSNGNFAHQRVSPRCRCGGKTLEEN